MPSTFPEKPDPSLNFEAEDDGDGDGVTATDRAACPHIGHLNSDAHESCPAFLCTTRLHNCFFQRTGVGNCTDSRSARSILACYRTFSLKIARTTVTPLRPQATPLFEQGCSCGRAADRPPCTVY